VSATGIDRRLPACHYTDWLYNHYMKYEAMHADPLSTTFAALADPTRRGILARLANGEATVTELAAPYAMSLPAVSRHLKVLARAGLIEQGRHAQWRPCRLRPEPLREVDDWIQRYREHLEQRLDRLETYLAEAQQADKEQDR
jgi:DNA-binding transcriptional ArsR family regulator